MKRFTTDSRGEGEEGKRERGDEAGQAEGGERGGRAERPRERKVGAGSCESAAPPPRRPRLGRGSAQREMASAGEQKFILDGVEQDCRVDGRTRSEFRPFVLDVSVLTGCHGSSRVLLGEGTDVMAAVKVEISSPAEKRPAEGIVKVHVEANPGFFVPKGGANLQRATSDSEKRAVAARIATILNALLSRSGALDLQKLCVVPGRFVWTVHVDVVLLRNAGNVVDAACLAVHAALRDTRIPEATPTVGEEGVEDDFEVVGELEAARPLPLAPGGLPLTASLTRIGGRLVVDANDEEEAASQAGLVVAVLRDGTIRGVHKTGGAAVPVRDLGAYLEAARAASRFVFGAVDEVVAKVQEQSTPDAPAERPNPGMLFGT